jgi:hypothetical protein
MRLKIKSCKKEIRRHFFSLRVVPEWNRLPDTVVCSPTLNSLKNRLDNVMKNKLYCYTG